MSIFSSLRPRQDQLQGGGLCVPQVSAVQLEISQEISRSLKTDPPILWERIVEC